MDTAEHEQFGTEELAICLSHYDLGIIRSVRPFLRGSRRAPKLVIDAEKGRFLFKRRARGRDRLDKVAFTHGLQIHLAGENFPLPHLIGTREENNSMLVLGSRIYEMFEFISGGGYDGSHEATYNAGRAMGLYHKLLETFTSQYEPPTGSYHAAGAVDQAIRNTAGSLPPESRPPDEELARTVKTLQAAYATCASRTNEIGLNDWNRQIVHGDWHPGNMLFRDRAVVAVIDYDSARNYQRAIDLANGALQFSIIGGGKDASRWAARLDEQRFQRFLSGYDSVNVISQAELQVVPYLMCEAMIAESVMPIAATGSFGSFEGFGFLQMIDRKVRWILNHVADLQKVLDD
ncbi:MAG: phosphotransferase [Phycisphaerae bacterium]|nr:phosphotransferase [Phycisphaerae bacterium]